MKVFKFILNILKSNKKTLTFIDALVSNIPKKDPEEICRRKESVEKNRKIGRELLAQFASYYKK